MDADVALSFQEVYRYSVAGCIIRPDPFSGETLEQFVRLEQYVLVQTSFDLSYKIGAGTDGFGFFEGIDHVLKVTFMPGQTEVSFSIAIITRVGRQIGAILPQDEPEGLRKIGRGLVSVKMVELCERFQHNGSTMLRSVELLHHLPQ